MTRYFLDTGVLLGFTFLHDTWRTEAEGVFDGDNSLYVNNVVLYEYCNNSDDNSLETADIDWETEEGRFGEIISFAEAIKMTFDIRIDGYADSEIDVKAMADDFIDVAQIEDDIDEEKIEEYIRPKLTKFIEDELDGRDLTVPVAREIGDVLFDTIIDGGRRKRDEIQDRVAIVTVAPEERESYFSRIDHFINGKNDTLILADVASLNDRGFLHKIITTDKNHMYSNRDRLDSTIGIDVQYVKDAVSEHSRPHSS